MKKYEKKVRKTDKGMRMGQFGRRVAAWACALALSITLSTAAFAEDPFGGVIQQQTQMADAIKPDQETIEAVQSEQEISDITEPEQETVEVIQPEQETSDIIEPEREAVETVQPEQTTANAVESGQQADTVPTEVPAPDTFEQELALDTENFPDPAFLESLRRFDLDADGALSFSEREAVTKIDVRNKGIQSMQGIGAFPNLTELNCIGNELSELPLDQMPQLISLLCNENAITHLDLACVPMLQVLHCHDNQLTELDVSHNPQLYEIACGDNMFTSLDVSHNPQLIYLLYLGGPLETLTLGENDALRELWCSYTLVSQLDLAQAPNLKMLGIEYSEIRFLDLEENQNLAHILAAGCRLLGAKLPAGASADLSAQRAVEVQIGAQETTFDLMRLGLPLDVASISDVTGAELQGSVLTGISDNATVTYRYQTAGAELTASIVFHVSNAWVEPLSLEDWIYGQPPHSPHAQAEYGNVVYTYSASVDGTFGPEVPSQAGTWYVKASVAESPEHAGLTAVEEFHIQKAHPAFAVPSGLTAVYASNLSSVDPGSGFVWKDPGQDVGSVGEKSFLATYIPADTDNYEIEYNVPIVVRVLPKQAQEEWVPDVTGPQDIVSLKITDGQMVLHKGQDYEITTREENDWVTVSILFRGNYTGQIRRGYAQESSVPVPPDVVDDETEEEQPQQWDESDSEGEDTHPEEKPSMIVPSEPGGKDSIPNKEKPVSPSGWDVSPDHGKLTDPDGQENVSNENASDTSLRHIAALCWLLIWFILLCLIIALWLYARYKKRKNRDGKNE